MPETVFGFKIKLNDYRSPVTASDTLGIYNRSTTLTANASGGQTYIDVFDSSSFESGDIINLTDDFNDNLYSVKNVSGSRIFLSDIIVAGVAVLDNATVTAGSVIRHVQVPISGISTSWGNRILLDGMDKFGREINLDYGGNVASPVNSGVALDNTIQINKELDDRGISLNGEYVEIGAFSGTTYSSLWYGSVESPHFDSKQFYIPFKSLYHTKIANIAKTINLEDYEGADNDTEGKTIPVSFGLINKAKFIKANSTEVTLSTTGIAVGTFSPADEVSFPIIGSYWETGSEDEENEVPRKLIYDVLIGKTVSITSVNLLTNIYLKVISGIGDGEYRLIKSIAQSPSNSKALRITLVDFPSVVYVGNATATEEENTWIQFIQIDKSYICDYWPIYSYLDDDYNQTSTFTSVYNYTSSGRIEVDNEENLTENVFNYESKFTLLPNYTYLSSGTSTKNSVQLSPSVFYSDSSSVSSVIEIQPDATGIRLYSGQYEDPSNLGLFGFTAGGYESSSFEMVINGLYYVTGISTATIGYVSSTANFNNCVDKDADTYHLIRYKGYKISSSELPSFATYDFELVFAYEIDLPEINDNFDFTNLYLGIRQSIEAYGEDVGQGVPAFNPYGSEDCKVMIYKRRWIGTPQNCIDSDIETSKTDSLYFNTGIKLESFNDLYLGESENNKNFNPKIDYSVISNTWIGATVQFTDKSGSYLGITTWLWDFGDGSTSSEQNPSHVYASGGSYEVTLTISGDDGSDFVTETVDILGTPIDNDCSYLVGHKNYDLSIRSRDEYMSYKSVIVLVYKKFSLTRGAQVVGVPVTRLDCFFDVKTYEIAFMFERKGSAGKEVFANIYGRIFNDTFDSRYNSAALNGYPQSQLEAICRLQNWQHRDVSPTDGWGKDYASNALINTTNNGDGSFSDSSLYAYNYVRSSRQILRYEDAYTDQVKRALCRNFWFANYMDINGRESVKVVSASNTSPSDTITLSNITDRKSIKIINSNPSNVFVEPFVRYNQNYATGEFESIMQITNTQADVYDSSYVKGISGSNAETYWNLCHELWLKSKATTKPPSDMTDLVWINSFDANADDYAEQYIYNWIQWMFHTNVSFTTHYNIVSDWVECHRFNLQLPHETNNAVYECMLTGIEINPNPPFDVKIDAIMFNNDIIPDILYIDVPQDVTTQYIDSTEDQAIQLIDTA